MCFQGYAHWLCGHTSLFEEECSLATSLEVSFYLKVACPNYTISVRSPQTLCGKGSFYCAQTNDGRKLDHLHAVCATTQEDITRIESSIYGENGLRERGNAIGSSILKSGGSKEDCDKDERIRSVFAEVGSLNREVEELKRKGGDAQGLIEQARLFYEQKAAYYAGGGRPRAPGLYPPMLQGVGPRPRPLANLAGGRERRRQMSVGQQHQTGVQYPGHVPDVHYQAEQCNAVPAQVEQYTPGFHHLGQYAAPPLQDVRYHTGHMQVGAGAYQPEIDRRQESSQSQPLQKRRRKNSSPEKPSPPIRRSSRVRTKKVTYAESESDPISRTPSPEKSDATDTTFSPSKETVQDTRSQIGRSSSLVDKIGDWQKREMTRTLREPLKQALTEYLAHTPPVSKPEQRQWNVNHYDVDAKIPPPNSHAPAQEWQVNRYDADLTIPAPIHQEEAEPKNTNYPSLWKSLASVVDLSSRAAIQHPNSEPQKRRFPIPLPVGDFSSSSKRMKLSFPGVEMAGQAPAPMLAPTAVRKAVTLEAEDVAPVQGDISVVEKGCDVELDEESELSDIDWDVLEEGISTD